MCDLWIKALRYTLSKSHVLARISDRMVYHGFSPVVIGRSDYFGLNWIFDCHLKTALNMFGAMTYPFQKLVRLCELVKVSLILQLCQKLSIWSDPYHSSPSGHFLCQAERGMGRPRSPQARENVALELESSTTTWNEDQVITNLFKS